MEKHAKQPDKEKVLYLWIWLEHLKEENDSREGGSKDRLLGVRKKQH